MIVSGILGFWDRSDDAWIVLLRDGMKKRGNCRHGRYFVGWLVLYIMIDKAMGKCSMKG